MSDMRDYLKLYGVYTNDWVTVHGGNTFNRHLVREYINTYCSCTSDSIWVSGGREFIYPFSLKKIYFLEGIIQGEILFESNVASSCSDYRITVFKLNADTVKTDLATTGVISVNDNYGVYNGLFYHWWIDLQEKKTLYEDDRLGLRVEWDVVNSSTVTAKLVHDNDDSSSTGLNLWVELPFLLGTE